MFVNIIDFKLMVFNINVQKWYNDRVSALKFSSKLCVGSMEVWNYYPRSFKLEQLGRFYANHIELKFHAVKWLQ